VLDNVRSFGLWGINDDISVHFASIGSIRRGCLSFTKIAATNFARMDLQAFAKGIDFWASRYQTFLGVMVAICVAYLTVSTASKQTSISERQFLSSQLQSLLGDQGTLRFVISQLNEAKMQRVLFENNVSFLDTAGDQTSGWQNGGNLIRAAYGNVEGFRALVSANTAKFMGPAEPRFALIAKLDSIVGTQDEFQKAFLNWANLNRNASPPLGTPTLPEKINYLEMKRKVLTSFDELLPLTKVAATQLGKDIERTEKDIAALRRVIDSKKND
jgi:hypothetical protein